MKEVETGKESRCDSFPLRLSPYALSRIQSGKIVSPDRLGGGQHVVVRLKNNLFGRHRRHYMGSGVDHRRHQPWAGGKGYGRIYPPRSRGLHVCVRPGGDPPGGRRNSVAPSSADPERHGKARSGLLT